MISELSLKVWAQEALQAEPYKSKLFPPSPYYRFLEILARQLKPELSVVLGVCGGGDCLHLALGNPEGEVIGIDIAYDHHEQIKHIYEVCPNFTFWLGDSVEEAPIIAEDFGSPTLLFIDTIHTRQRTLAEFEAWKPYLTESYIVCFDDLLRPEMEGLWEELPEPKLRLDILHDGAESGGGFGVVWNR